MLSSKRKKFFDLLAKNYEEYSFPTLCGWIEALMHLEPKKWTQKDLSNRLSELFTNPDSTTSLSSVNRAVKILEEYGTILKTGSRKIGYYYTLSPDSQVVINMFQHMLNTNNIFINELAAILKTENLSKDEKLQKTIRGQLTEAEKLSKFLVNLLDSYK